MKSESLRHTSPSQGVRRVAFVAALTMIVVALSGPGSAVAGSVTFGPRTDFGAGVNPAFVAAADLDGDGILDLAVANAISRTVSVLLGDGTGSFGPTTDFATGSLPNSITVGDFDANGAPDLVVANYGSGDVSVLLGDGNGSFGPKTDFIVGSDPRSPTSVAVGDFDGNGAVDLAVAFFYSGSVSVLLGDGSGSFGPTTEFATGYGPNSVAVGDFDADGNADLAVANGGTGVSVLLGDGTGGFGPKTDFGTTSTPPSLTVGDFDDDRVLDLAVANFFSDTVSVLLGSGAGSFGPKTDFGTGPGPYAVATADFDVDGALDLAVANQSAGSVSVLRGDGSGSFAPKSDVVTGLIPTSVAIGDFNGDGAPDLAVTDRSSASVAVLLNTSSRAFAFIGFFSPVENPPVLNVVTGGQAVPVRFSLGGDQGLSILEAGFPRSAQVSCDPAAPVDGIEETVTAGASSLSYDATTDRYSYVWKTDKSWANTCRQLVLKLTDGTYHRATFKFR